MPGMSGVDLLRRVKGLYPDVIRIVVSAEVDANTATDAVNQGAVFRVLKKSSDPEYLRTSLREAFAQCRRTAQGRLDYRTPPIPATLH
jgi:DNA-binding NtrC family response regulator